LIVKWDVSLMMENVTLMEDVISVTP